MNIHFHMNEADYVSANWAYFRHHWLRFLYGYRLPIGISGAAIAVMLVHPERSQDAAWILSIGIGLIAYILIAHRWTSHRQFQRSPFRQRLVSATINGDSVRLSVENHEVVKTWSELTDIYESHRLFLFGTAKGKILFLPKASMSEPQIKELRSLISAKAMGKVKLTSAIA
jgi:hypothetical protein